MNNLFVLSDDGKLLVKVLDKTVKNIVIPNSVMEIGDDAFRDCASLESIVIPNSVTEIGNSAFSGCTSLESIDIPNGVTLLFNSTFKGCISLKDIRIPNSVLAIDDSAFEGCTSLKSIDIPNSVFLIGDSAFEGCTSLENIDIPDSVNEIGTNAFHNTKLLDEQPDGTVYVNNILCTFNGSKNIEKFVIKEGTKIIASSVFKDFVSLEEIDIPNSVLAIDDSAFEGCTSLKSIDIPNSVIYIGSHTFQGCTSLRSIDIPNSVAEIGYSAFEACTSLECIAIPNSVKTIRNSAFKDCTSLESIDIPNSITEIYDSTFKNCTSLNCIDIPNSVIYIGSSTFQGCTSLKSIDIPNSVTAIGNLAFGGCKSLNYIDIPNGVKTIGAYAFSNTNIKKIIIPSSIRSIKEKALCDCPLFAIDVDKDNPIYFSLDGILYKRINGKENILIKYPPQKHGNSFSVCESTKMIETCAFEGAIKLQEILLHNSISSLGDERTFEGCKSLKRMKLPPSIQSIPLFAFFRCESLEEVFLPNLEHYTIAQSIFEHCSSLKSIHSATQNPDGIVVHPFTFGFDFNFDECTLYIPPGTRWAYRHHPEFGQFKNIEIEKI